MPTIRCRTKRDSTVEVLASDSDSDDARDDSITAHGRMVFQGQLTDTERRQVEALGGVYGTLARGVRASVWQRAAAAEEGVQPKPPAALLLGTAAVVRDHHIVPAPHNLLHGRAKSTTQSAPFGIVTESGTDDDGAMAARRERLHAVSVMGRSLRALYRCDAAEGSDSDDEDASPRRCARIEAGNSPVRRREASSRLSGVVDGALSVRRSSQRLEKSTSCAAAYFGSPESPAAHATESSAVDQHRGDSIMKISRNLLDTQFDAPTPLRNEVHLTCSPEGGAVCFADDIRPSVRHDACGGPRDEGIWPRLLQHCSDSKVVVPLMSPVSPDLLACCASGTDLASSFAIYLSSSGASSSENSQVGACQHWNDDSDTALHGALDAILASRAAC